MPETTLGLKIYRCLLKLYPASFRGEYAAAMEKEYLDELADSRGGFQLAGLWFRMAVDMARSLPQQIASEVGQDARHALRLWAKRPWQTGIAVLSLAIGIGANTGMFSVVDTLSLQALPFRNPTRLASLDTYLVPHDSARQFQDWRQGSMYLADAALFEQSDFNLGSSENVVRAHVSQISWNFFSILGVRPLVGRAFSPGEDMPGRNGVAVIGYGLWQQLFAGNREVVGQSLRVNGAPFTVVGVMPSGFDFPSGTEVWEGATFHPGNNGWETVARLKSGVSWAQARAAFEAEMQRLSPDPNRSRDPKYSPKMRSLRDELSGAAENASFILLAGVALILLIACSNVANLLMARTADRASELSIRSALGANRARLIQQLLTECLLLSFAAAIAGFLVARWTISVAARVEPLPLATESYSILNGHVIIFVVLVTIGSAVFFGILPAVQAGRTHRFATRGESRTRNSRFHREILVAVQVMLTIVLLASSVSAGRAFLRLMHTDRGFKVRGLMTASVSLEGTTHQESKLSYFEDALARVRRLPSVRSASVTDFLPLNATGFVGGPFGLDGLKARARSILVPVFPEYFKTMGGRILYGREFSNGELRSNARVAVVSQQFAGAFGRSADALGHAVTIGDDQPLRIVGVVGGMDYMAEGSAASQIFVPAHSPGDFSSTFVVRLSGQSDDGLAAVRDAIRSTDTRVPVFGVKTMRQRLDEALAKPKFYRTALGFFGGFALLLAVIGIYGVVSYAVAQRTREMGVRLSLGTTPTRLRRMLLRQGLFPVAAGAAAGLFGASFAGRFLESLVSGAKALDYETLSSVTLLIFVLTSTTIWLATRRIARLDVIDVLRAE